MKLDTTKEGIETVKGGIMHFHQFMPKDFVSQNPEFIGWLEQAGFFNAPAASMHHGNYTGGLFDHSLAVAKALVYYTEKLGLEWERSWSPHIVGMFHDMCKLESYVFSPEDGCWTYTDNPGVIPGHGEKSVIMLQQHIKLTDEEVACIRWHMGAFEGKEMWSDFSNACKKVPNVLYTHTADMYASQVLGI